MAKLLKITKSDGTNHAVPLSNKAFWEAHNNRQKNPLNKVKLEDIDEKDAENLPYRDKDFVNAADAVSVVDDLKKESAEKDAEIERLKALLAGKTDGGNALPSQHPQYLSNQQSQPSQKTAVEVISLINAATTVEEVENLAKGDERKTVKDAADNKIAALKAA